MDWDLRGHRNKLETGSNRDVSQMIDLSMDLFFLGCACPVCTSLVNHNNSVKSTHSSYFIFLKRFGFFMS